MDHFLNIDMLMSKGRMWKDRMKNFNVQTYGKAKEKNGNWGGGKNP